MLSLVAKTPGIIKRHRRHHHAVPLRLQQADILRLSKENSAGNEDCRMKAKSEAAATYFCATTKFEQQVIGQQMRGTTLCLIP